MQTEINVPTGKVSQLLLENWKELLLSELLMAIIYALNKTAISELPMPSTNGNLGTYLHKQDFV